jgi:hypothetical protein
MMTDFSSVRLHLNSRRDVQSSVRHFQLQRVKVHSDCLRRPSGRVVRRRTTPYDTPSECTFSTVYRHWLTADGYTIFREKQG